MREERVGVTREEVIRFYVNYDLHKKSRNVDSILSDMRGWDWNDPDRLDERLEHHKLKKGVLSAYQTWKLVQLDVTDLLQCAIVNRIFPKEPQTLCQLVLRGKLAEWLPKGAPGWWRLIGEGEDLDAQSALILRDAVSSEAPAKWYVEDGSGRAIALLQRMLRYGEIDRSAWGYLGDQTDERSSFIKGHQELMH